MVINANWIFRNGISCISETVNKAPNFKVSSAKVVKSTSQITYCNFFLQVDAFELIVLWLMYEKQRGCKGLLRIEIRIKLDFE